MALFDCNKIISALAIRDTSNHDSIIDDSRSFTPQTIAVANGLNQTVTCQLQGSPLEDFSVIFDIGSTFDVTATTNGYQTVNAKFLFFRLRVSCSTSPTTGTVIAYIIKGE